jgi:hypothetical protein
MDHLENVVAGRVFAQGNDLKSPARSAWRWGCGVHSVSHSRCSKREDQALYRAKWMGRNRIVLWECGTVEEKRRRANGGGTAENDPPRESAGGQTIMLVDDRAVVLGC